MSTETKAEFGEPWAIYPAVNPAYFFVGPKTNNSACEVFAGREQAERIVACINFCAGLRDDQLTDKDSMPWQILINERDEYREQLAAKDAEIERLKKAADLNSWKFALCHGTFQFADCKIADIGHSDKIAHLECPEMSATISTLQARVKELEEGVWSARDLLEEIQDERVNVIASGLSALTKGEM